MAATDGVEGLALDLDELKHLQSVAKRPRVLSLISAEIQKLEKVISTFYLSKDATSVSPVPTPISTAPKIISNPALSYSTVASFSWDQDNDKVKIYISLEGVDQEKMETDFKPTSVDVKFHDVQGKNYRFSLSKLNKEIVPEKCKVMVKPTRVTFTLPKASKGNWLDLLYKEDKFKPSVEKEKDPMAGIMDLMKVKVYIQIDSHFFVMQIIS
nr:calcyclin-binding protein-like [Ipomoea batatas]